MAFSNTYVFGFASVICVVCALGVASTSLGLRDLQDLNKLRDTRGAVLGSLGLPEDGHAMEGEEIDRLWEERVTLVVIDGEGHVVNSEKADLNGDGITDEADLVLAMEQVKGTDRSPALLAVYQRVDDDRVAAYAFPVYGKGLWGPISGYISLEPDGETVKGATFFAPKETPGLGAEITEPPFQDQWAGKKIADADGNAKPIKVLKAGAVCKGDEIFCVDGVSGATITTRGADQMVKLGIECYHPYFDSIRGTR